MKVEATIIRSGSLDDPAGSDVSAGLQPAARKAALEDVVGGEAGWRRTPTCFHLSNEVRAQCVFLAVPAAILYLTFVSSLISGFDFLNSRRNFDQEKLRCGFWHPSRRSRPFEYSTSLCSA